MSQRVGLRECGFIFNYFDVIGMQSCRLTQNNGHYAVQGHSRSPILVPVKTYMRLSISDKYKLASYLTPFPSYCMLLVIVALSTGRGRGRVPVFNTLVRGEPLNSEPRHLASRTRNDVLSCHAKCISIS